VNVASGEQVGATLDTPSDIADWRRAWNVNTIAAFTEKNQIFYIDEAFTKCEALPNVHALGLHCGINPDGDYITGTRAQSLFRWKIKEPTLTIEDLKSREFDTEFVIALAGPDSDRWINGTQVQEYKGDKHYDWIGRYGMENLPGVLNEVVNAAVVCSDGDYSWITLACNLATLQDPKPLVVTSLRVNPLGDTVLCDMLPIEGKTATRMFGTKLGDRLAIMTDAEIQICDRSYFDDQAATVLAWQMSIACFHDEQLEAIEKVAEQLRSQNWKNRGMTGEELYGKIVFQIALKWARITEKLERDGVSDALDRFEAWKERGSDMALFASAMRHSLIGSWARGSDTSDKVTEDGWKELDERMKLMQRDFDQILKLPKPSAGILEHYIEAMKYESKSFDELLPVVLKYMQLYPNETMIHSGICEQLLPRWGGGMGSGHSYMQHIADCYPPEISDAIYATPILLKVGQYHMNRIHTQGELGVDIDRAARGVRLMRDQGLLTRELCEAMIFVSIHTQRYDLLDEFTMDFVNKFLTNSRSGITNNVAYRLSQRRYFIFLDANKRPASPFQN
jgi:hypothetical protein